MRDALGNSKKFAIVSVYELLESSHIPILAGMNEIQVVGGYRPHFELCCVCRHNCSRRVGEQPLVKARGTEWKRRAVSVAVPSANPGSLHHDLAGHLRMDRA